MNLKQIEYFIAIVEEGQITAAAKRLHIAQPPLSQQLKNLEEEFNVKLFERNSRRLVLTDIGERFYERSQQIIALKNSITKEILDYSMNYEGNIRIGITPTSIPYVLGKEFQFFVKAYPKMTFEFFEGNTPSVIDMLRKKIVDIGIVRTPFNSTGLNYYEKDSEKMVAVMSKEFNWSDSKTCEILELNHRNIILYHRYEALITDVFTRQNTVPHVVCKTDKSYTALRCAESGIGIAILPEGALKMASNDLVFKIINEKRLMTQTTAIWIHDTHLSKPLLAFLEYFKEL